MVKLIWLRPMIARLASRQNLLSTLVRQLNQAQHQAMATTVVDTVAAELCAALGLLGRTVPREK